MKNDDQFTLFDQPPDWSELWQGMPEFNHEDKKPWQTLNVHFRNLDDYREFAKLVEQKLTEDTKSIWYPVRPKTRFKGHRRFDSKTILNPRYPVYVISKGRWESRLTSKALENIGVPYSIVVEPQEFDQYASVIDARKILVLPFSNLGLGSIPARNWVWQHSKECGHLRHWIMDDNIRGFYRWNNNLRTPVTNGNIFRAAEDFCDRYTNIALAGLQYRFFAVDGRRPPVDLNTRIYSCILIQNDIPFEWRGRYNEDTDLSIRALKAGYCTALFYFALADKIATMTMKGGNTDELYKQDEQMDGRLLMAKSLQEQHPDVTTIIERWGRWQHYVDYTPFKDNKLIKRKGVVIPHGINDYGLNYEENTNN